MSARRHVGASADRAAAGSTDRFDVAVDIVLSSGLLDQRQMDLFWAFVDGEITADALRKEIS